MTQFDESELRGATVHDQSGAKVGKVTDVYYDDQTSKPEWVLVATGMFGSKEALVPLAAATRDGDDLRISLDKDTVRNAPHLDPDSELSPHEEAELFDYYGIPYGGETVTATGGPGQSGNSAEPAAVGRDLSGPTTDNAMTRSEERLRVGTQTVESGRARLRKYVVTENVTQTVPVSHEEVRVEREPITDANVEAAMDGPEISEEVHEVTLHEERPVVAKETVPVERVRLATDTVRGQQQVSDSVRREEIATEGTPEQ